MICVYDFAPLRTYKYGYNTQSVYCNFLRILILYQNDTKTYHCFGKISEAKRWARLPSPSSPAPRLIGIAHIHSITHSQY